MWSNIVMTTHARDLVKDGKYHAYNRGHNGMTIFREAADFIFYFQLIMTCQIKYGFEVFAVCLMRNHYHILIKDVGIQLPIIMDTINSIYARYHNKKNSHKGAVFDGPFKSNRVLSDYGFLRLFRYIIRNPVAAGIASSVLEYKWVTATKEMDRYNIINFDYVDEISHQVCNCSYDELLNSDEDDLWLDDIEIHRVEDCHANELFKRIVSKLTGHSEFIVNKIDRATQVDILTIANNMGITQRQLSNLSGFSKGKVNYMINSN